VPRRCTASPCSPPFFWPPSGAGVWTGAPLHVSVPAPRGERVAAILQAEDGSIIGAATIADLQG
jgi:hypothetical protein